MDVSCVEMDENHVEMLPEWKYVEEGILKLKKILEGEPETPFSPKEYMELYTIIYNLCTDKENSHYSGEVYDNYCKILKEYIESTVLPSIKNMHDECMLQELVKRWSNHQVMVRWLSRFFSYLNRYYIPRVRLPSIDEIGLIYFRHLVYLEVQEMAREAAITLINKEREGETIDRSLLKSIVNIFVEVGIEKMSFYEEDFEKPMLDDTSDYYKRKATNWIEVDTFSEYMMKVEQCLNSERQRAHHYLHDQTTQKLTEKVKHVFLVDQENQLLEKENSSFREFLKNEKVEDLCRFYRLYRSIPNNLEFVANIFKEEINAECTELFRQAEEYAKNQPKSGPSIHDHILFRKIMDVHERFISYVSYCFANHSLFQKALKDTFEIFCNKTFAGCPSAEFFTKFCDNVLRKGGTEKLSNEAIEETLTKVVRLLVYVNDKDHFFEFYRRKLAQRLLFIQGIDAELERNILTLLKHEFGVQFPAKMLRMVKDSIMSREYRTSFDEYLRGDHLNLGIDFSVNVLTFGFWPSYKQADLILPSEMRKCMESYNKYFSHQNEGRKLKWINSLGVCHINGNFELKSIELVVSTYQAAVLQLFNNADRLSYSHIMDQLELEDEDLVRVLHSLSCAKYEILKKEPKSNAISPDDSFEFNSKFTNKMNRIKIPLPPVEGRTKVVEVVSLERRFAIDAALVRIMKSRKVMDHSQLVSECVEQLSRTFKPEIKTIKRRIEELIAREYLERDIANPRIFKYMT